MCWTISIGCDWLWLTARRSLGLRHIRNMRGVIRKKRMQFAVPWLLSPMPCKQNVTVALHIVAVYPKNCRRRRAPPPPAVYKDYYNTGCFLIFTITNWNNSESGQPNDFKFSANVGLSLPCKNPHFQRNSSLFRVLLVHSEMTSARKIQN